MTLNTMFLVCFFVGVGVSAISLLGSFGHLSAVHLHHHGIAPVAHHAAGHGGQAQASRGGSGLLGHLFNIAALTTFLAWFGGAGLMLEETSHWPAIAVLAVATVSGVTGATAINRVMRALRSREVPLEPISLVGVVGKVTVPIRAGGTGEIVYTVDGARRCSGARADEPEVVIERGAQVFIARYDKGIAYVCRLDDIVPAGRRDVLER